MKANNNNINGFSPYQKQRDIIDCCLDSKNGHQYIAVTKGRQVGLTLTGVNICIAWALQNEASTTMVIQPTYKQLRKVLRQFNKYLSPFRKYIDVNKSEMLITFPNGSEILLISGESEDSIRGNTPHYLWIDEAAYVSDYSWQAAIAPSLSTSDSGRKVLLSSTPAGKGNFFHTLYHAPFTKCFKIKSSESPLITEEKLKILQYGLPVDLIAQEFEGEFIDGGGKVFPNIAVCATIFEWEEPQKHKHYYIGIDWGKEDDCTSVVVMDEEGNVVFIYSVRYIKWNLIVGNVAEIIKKYNAEVLAETNGVGSVAFDDLIAACSTDNIEGYNMNAKGKVDLIETTVGSFSTMSIKIPSIELYPDLYKELESFTFEYQPMTRTIKYGHPEGMHDDNVIALCLANKHRLDHIKSGKGVMRTGAYRSKTASIIGKSDVYSNLDDVMYHPFLDEL